MPSAAVVAFWLDNADWSIGRLLLVANRFNTAPFSTCNRNSASLAESVTYAQLSISNLTSARIDDSETRAELD